MAAAMFGAIINIKDSDNNINLKDFEWLFCISYTPKTRIV